MSYGDYMVALVAYALELPSHAPRPGRDIAPLRGEGTLAEFVALSHPSGRVHEHLDANARHGVPVDSDA